MRATLRACFLLGCLHVGSPFGASAQAPPAPDHDRVDSDASPEASAAPEVEGHPADASLSTDRAKARAHYRTAVALYEAGDFNGALRLFQLAYDETRSPVLLFNIAQCHWELHHYQPALADYERFLEIAGDSQLAPKVRARVADLKAVLAAARQKDISTGQQIIQKPESSTGVSPVAEAGGEPRVVDTARDRPASEEPQQAAGPASGGGKPPVKAPPAAADNSPGALRIASYTAFAVGGAALLASVVLGQAVRSTARKASDATVYDPETDRRGRRLQTLHYVSLGVAGAAVVTAGALLLVDIEANRPVDRAALVLLPEVTPRSAGLSVQGGF